VRQARAVLRCPVQPAANCRGGSEYSAVFLDRLPKVVPKQHAVLPRQPAKYAANACYSPAEQRKARHKRKVCRVYRGKNVRSRFACRGVAAIQFQVYLVNLKITYDCHGKTRQQKQQAQ